MRLSRRTADAQNVPCYVFNRAGRVVWFAPFNATSREVLAARLGLLLFRDGQSNTRQVRYWHKADNLTVPAFV
jgi:hypothetical protein